MEQEKANRPSWMNDPMVKDIPPQKLNFLERMFRDGQGKNQKDMIALLMPMMRKAKQENLTFTPQEMTAAIGAIKKYSSPKELQKIDEILKKTR